MTEMMHGTSLESPRGTRTHRVMAPGGGWDLLVADESAVVVVAHYINWRHVEWACVVFDGDINDEGPPSSQGPHALVARPSSAWTGHE